MSFSGETPSIKTGRGLDRLAGWLFIAAAAIHGGLAPEHFAEWWGYGLFFLAAGLVQVVWGLAFLTDAVNPRDAGRHWRAARTALLVLGLLGTLSTIALYVVTRTTGIPWFGPEAGTVEEVAPIDIVSKVVEGTLAAVLAVLLARHLRLRAPAEGPGDGEPGRA